MQKCLNIFPKIFYDFVLLVTCAFDMQAQLETDGLGGQAVCTDRILGGRTRAPSVPPLLPCYVGGLPPPQHPPTFFFSFRLPH